MQELPDEKSIKISPEVFLLLEEKKNVIGNYKARIQENSYSK